MISGGTPILGNLHMLDVFVVFMVQMLLIHFFEVKMLLKHTKTLFCFVRINDLKRTSSKNWRNTFWFNELHGFFRSGGRRWCSHFMSTIVWYILSVSQLDQTFSKHVWSHRLCAWLFSSKSAWGNLHFACQRIRCYQNPIRIATGLLHLPRPHGLDIKSTGHCTHRGLSVQL